MYNFPVPITYNKRTLTCKFGDLPCTLIHVYGAYRNWSALGPHGLNLTLYGTDNARFRRLWSIPICRRQPHKQPTVKCKCGDGQQMNLFSALLEQLTAVLFWCTRSGAYEQHAAAAGTGTVHPPLVVRISDCWGRPCQPMSSAIMCPLKPDAVAGMTGSREWRIAFSGFGGLETKRVHPRRWISIRFRATELVVAAWPAEWIAYVPAWQD